MDRKMPRRGTGVMLQAALGYEILGVLGTAVMDRLCRC